MPLAAHHDDTLVTLDEGLAALHASDVHLLPT
jgi:hypothetical protein